MLTVTPRVAPVVQDINKQAVRRLTGQATPLRLCPAFMLDHHVLVSRGAHEPTRNWGRWVMCGGQKDSGTVAVGGKRSLKAGGGGGCSGKVVSRESKFPWRLARGSRPVSQSTLTKSLYQSFGHKDGVFPFHCCQELHSLH